MASERITFIGSSGETLAARLDWPEGPHLATALFAHCFTCSKDIPAARRIAGRLTAAGIAVLRFDFTGLGHSDGEFSNTNFSSNVADLVAAAQFLESQGMAPDLLIGHSLGGAAVLRGAGAMDSVRAVVTIGAPYDPAHVANNFENHIDTIEEEGEAEVNLGGRSFRIRRHFLRDIGGANLEQDIADLRKALLVLHAPRDEVVSVENARSIFRQAKHPKSFVTLDNADHLVSEIEDAEYAADIIATWATRYLDLKAPVPPPGAPEGVVRVSEADPDGYLQDINAGPTHHALADEPRSYGGTDLGMTPYGFLSAGLGACTSMTIRMYARRKGWLLTHVRVDVTHDKVHAQDAGQDDEKVDTFRRVIFIEGDLDQAQRARLLEIADRCPVHQTLERTSRVESVLA